MRDLKNGESELWVRTETGFWLVLADLHEYNLDKPMARAGAIEEIQRTLKDNQPTKAADAKN